MEQEEEKSIVKKAQKDPKFFEKLYREYHDKIHRYVQGMVSNATIADDLTSVVFEKALEKISSFRWQGVSFGSWLYRIARNTVYDYFRSARTRRTSQLGPSMEESIDAKVSLEENVLHDESELKLYSVIAKLNSNDQYLLYYRYFEGMSVREVARKVKMSEANVATRLHRIRNELRGILDIEDETS